MASPDGSFGGPMRVATNLATELRRRGHQVVIVAGQRGYDETPTSLSGVPARLFGVRRVLPISGFAGLASPDMLRWFREASRDFDVMHVHLARDLITLPMARLAIARGLPVVAQTHGMIRPRRDLAARIIDAALTRPVLARADAVTFLTDQEKTDLVGVSRPGVRLSELRNGIVIGPAASETRRSSPEALFLGRLHPRKRAPVFVEAALRLLEDGVDARFAIVGPDEGDLPQVLAAIGRSRHHGAFSVEGALDPDDTGARMARSDVFVLPSVDEPYPMAVLEAMALGLPVVVTDTCGLAGSVSQGAGYVADAGVESLTEAMRRLLTGVDERITLGEKAREIVRRDHDIASVATTLEQMYVHAARGGTAG